MSSSKKDQRHCNIDDLRYAMICSMLIGSFNIAIGTFDSLVTFVGTMIEVLQYI